MTFPLNHIAQLKKQGKIPPIKTNALTKEALRILNLKGFRVWRQNNTGVWDEKIQSYRASENNLHGVSDIIGYHKRTGQFIACEIKAGKDILSQAQKIFLADVANSGGVALVVRTTEDLEEFLKR